MKKARSDCDVTGNNHGHWSAEKFGYSAARWAFATNFVDHVHITLPAVPSRTVRNKHLGMGIWELDNEATSVVKNSFKHQIVVEICLTEIDPEGQLAKNLVKYQHNHSGRLRQVWRFLP